MEPLISTSNGMNKRNKYYGRTLCIMAAIIFIAIIVTVGYFSNNNLNNESPAKSFLDRPDNSNAYDRTYEFEDTGLTWKPKPKGGMPLPKQSTGETDTGFGDGYSSSYGDTGYSSAYGDDQTEETDETQESDQTDETDQTDDNQQDDDDGYSYSFNWGDDDGTDETDETNDDNAEQEQEPQQEQEPEQEQDVGEEDRSVELEDIASRIVIESDASLASSYYNEDGEDDEIKTMPYLLKATCSASKSNCGFKQYSGYLLANNNAEIHYWFIEAEETPKEKPLFFWTNGGPGCSGMDGLLTEHGPWKVYDNLKVHYNPYSWINEVNMVYLEQPYGVGFSSVDEAVPDVVAGDQNAADDMDAAIRNFLIKFPDYASNEIYLSSESWGGHYVPMTTYTILQNNGLGKTPHINLKGFLLGNPYTDFYENTYGFVGDIYGHGLLKSSDWDTWRESCWDNEHGIDNEAVCSAIYSRAYWASYNSNVYALDWPQCTDDERWEDSRSRPSHENDPWWIQDSHIHHAAKQFMQRVLEHHNYDSLKMNMERSELQALHDKIAQRLELADDLTSNSGGGTMHGGANNDNKVGPRARKANDRANKKNSNLFSSQNGVARVAVDDTNEYLPCIEYDMADYLNLPQVQNALHVKPTTWEMCSDAVWNAWPESDYDRRIESYYSELVETYPHAKLTVYSGDDDSVCGLQGTQYWLDRWKYDANPDVEWEAWEDDDSELGGFYTQYLNDDGDVGLHFITIRTAGHMVPTTEPSRALTLLRKYLYDFE